MQDAVSSDGADVYGGLRARVRGPGIDAGTAEERHAAGRGDISAVGQGGIRRLQVIHR